MTTNAKGKAVADDKAIKKAEVAETKAVDTKETTPPPLPTNPDIETVTFETPIERGDQVIESVNINKPKAGALRGLSLAKLLELDVDTVIKLVPRVSTPPLAEHEVSGADLVDLMQLSTAVISFFASKEQKAKAKAMEA